MPSRNAQVVSLGVAGASDSLLAWTERYQALAVRGVRSDDVAAKIELHLGRFVTFFTDAYGHDRTSACLPRDVVGWRRALVMGGFAPATINNHLASLGGFTSWVSAQAPGLADFNGVGPPVGSVLVRTDTVTGRRPLVVDQLKEVGTFAGHTRGLLHGHGQA